MKGRAEKPFFLGREAFISFTLHVVCVLAVCMLCNRTPQVTNTVQVMLMLSPAGGGGGAPEKVPAKLKVRHTPARAERHPRPAARSAAPVYPAAKPLIERPAPAGAPSAPLLAQDEVWSSAGGTGGGKGTGTGTGTGSGAGTGSGTGVGSGSGDAKGSGHTPRESAEALRTRYLREHFAYIRDLILNHLTYPALAKKLGWQGSVTVSFIIKENGRIEGAKIMESSGYELLDSNVVDTILDVQPFPKPPVKAEIVLPVTYALK